MKQASSTVTHTIHNIYLSDFHTEQKNLNLILKSTKICIIVWDVNNWNREEVLVNTDLRLILQGIGLYNSVNKCMNGVYSLHFVSKTWIQQEIKTSKIYIYF